MNTSNKKPAMYDLDMLLSMGMNPETGLPLKMSSPMGLEYNLKPEIKKTLRIADEATAINRYVWYNLPKGGLNSQLLERILYFKGKGMFFYMQDGFYFLPYALDGSINVYGQFTGVTPIAFGGGTNNPDDKKIKPWIPGLTKKPIYEVQLLEELDLDTLEDGCVLLNDYTPQLSQVIIPRAQLQEPYLDMMAELLPFCRTSLLNSTGVSGIRVGSVDEQSNVDAASRSINRAALMGQKWIPIIGQLDFQDLTNGNTNKAEDFLLLMQSIDNIRLSMYGLGDGMILEKKAHMLQTEASMNQSNVSLILQDGLTNRQHFCDIVNSIWNLNIWCDLSETASGVDKNFDGEISDQQDQSGTAPGAQPVVEEEVLE